MGDNEEVERKERRGVRKTKKESDKRMLIMRKRLRKEG